MSRMKKQTEHILSVLDDIAAGNLGRRAIAHGDKTTNEICYKINQIAQSYESRISQAAKTERATKQLMTSLSHDVRTPLTTLIGYLDAIMDNVVEGEERERYIASARVKAYTLKAYTDDLFEWFKLNSDERAYSFEMSDIGELTRNVLSDWIPQLERAGISYGVEIPDDEINVKLDISAFTRILNNLIQNAVQHSEGTYVGIAIRPDDENVQIEIFDNGKGISANDLPHIFDRLYKADEARTVSSSGLGLSIVYELVKAQNGTMIAQSVPDEKTSFIINMKKAR